MSPKFALLAGASLVALASAAAAQQAGLFDRVVHRACTISVAATRSDLRSAADRERECR